MILSLILVSIASLIGNLFRYIGFQDTNIVLLYIIAVLLSTIYSSGHYVGIITSILSTLAFNYFFTAPYFSLSVNDPNYVITLVIMAITSLIASSLTLKVKQNANEAHEREKETKSLLDLTNRLTDSKNIDDIFSILIKNLNSSFEIPAAYLAFDENGFPETTFIQISQDGNSIRRETENINEIKHSIENLKTQFDIGSEFCDWPVYGRDSILGLVRIPIKNSKLMTEPQLRLLRSMIESIALALDRFYAAQQKIKSIGEAKQERYRSDILRSISHDLRTPLSGIIGTSEILLSMTEEQDMRYSLISSIHSDSEWLKSLVENILNLTKLQDGRLVLKKEFEAAEEIIGSALFQISKRYPEFEITTQIPEDLVLIPMDAKLIEQVLINLIDNAIRHSSSEKLTLLLYLDENNTNATFIISDYGIGIPDEKLPFIFQPFYTATNSIVDSRRSIGLGLTICKAIIKAHGGNIQAKNKSDEPGAEFIFTLPMEVSQNE